jgi:hypothetical protein
MTNWNALNRTTLENLYDKGFSDTQIAGHFKTGTYAIAKQRSVMGLVKFKKRKGIKRLPRKVAEVKNKPFYALHYRKDGVNHFSYLDTNDPEKVKEIARNLIYTQKVEKVTLLQPTTQLICQKIKEITL